MAITEQTPITFVVNQFGIERLEYTGKFKVGYEDGTFTFSDPSIDTPGGGWTWSTKTAAAPYGSDFKPVKAEWVFEGPGDITCYYMDGTTKTATGIPASHFFMLFNKGVKWSMEQPALAPFLQH